MLLCIISGLFLCLPNDVLQILLLNTLQPGRVRLFVSWQAGRCPSKLSHTEQGSIAVIVDIDCDFSSGITTPGPLTVIPHAPAVANTSLSILMLMNVGSHRALSSAAQSAPSGIGLEGVVCQGDGGPLWQAAAPQCRLLPQPRGTGSHLHLSGRWRI